MSAEQNVVYTSQIRAWLNEASLKDPGDSDLASPSGTHH